MEKAVLIFQYSSLQIDLKEAASGVDDPNRFIQAEFQLPLVIHNTFHGFKIILKFIRKPHQIWDEGGELSSMEPSK